MLQLRHNRLFRRVTLLLAVLFTAFTLILEGTHRHASPYASHQVVASDKAINQANGCPLCDWLAVSYVAPPVPHTVTVISTVSLVLCFVLAAVSLCKPVVPHRGLRAPPVFLKSTL